MKFAVHCAPSVNVWTPGWIGAVAAGAQADALPASASSAATARSAAASIVRIFNFVSPVETDSRYALGAMPHSGDGFFPYPSGAEAQTPVRSARAQDDIKTDSGPAAQLRDSTRDQVHPPRARRRDEDPEVRPARRRLSICTARPRAP